MTPTEALKEWAEERYNEIPWQAEREEIIAAILSGVVKGLEAGKAEVLTRLDDAPAASEAIDALLKVLSDSEAPERSENLKERTT